jgi:hypothetical protein
VTEASAGDGTQPFNTYRQDMWALELQTTAGGLPSPAPAAQGSGWFQVSPTDPDILQSWPEGRYGPSWTGYTVDALLFGGLATNDGSPAWPTCMQGLSPASPAPSQCIFYQDVWSFMPGTTDWFTAVTNGSPNLYGANAWVRLGASGANGGPMPAGRAEHIAAHHGDLLFIYGGFTALGPVTAADALWTYSIASQTWSNIPSSTVAPPTGPGTFATGTFIARHLYVWVEQEGQYGGQLWRWAPNTTCL